MITQFKKYLCLVLSAALIFLNGQVFAQEIAASDIVSKVEIDELNRMASNVYSKYVFSREHIRGDASYINYILQPQPLRNPYPSEGIISSSLNKFHSNLEEFETLLAEFQTKFRTTYQRYIEALPEGTYLREATAKYINRRMDELFSRQNHVLENMLNISDLIQEQPEIINMSDLMSKHYTVNQNIRIESLRQHYIKDTRIRNSFVQDLAERQAYYDKLFTWDVEKLLDQLEAARTSFSRETIEFFNKPNHTVEEVMEYFVAHGPKEQKALQFAVRTTDRGLTTTHLINYLRYYLKHTNRRLWKLERYSAANLTKVISGMPFEKRVEYIDNLLDFSPETKALRAELRQAEQQAGKRLINRGSIKLAGTFIVIGAPLIALTITTLVSNNTYQQSNIQKLAEIKNKIDDRELISLDEMFEFFTSERNVSRGEENLLQLAETFEAIRTVNTLMDNSDLDLSVTEDDLQEEMGNLQQQIPADLNESLNNLNLTDITAQINALRI